ncbi:hypothetical protein GW17_00006498 [Ensete ventricosum]|nr:hypothetical protein GW17_00006498 [Ensete ventricosum]
MLDDGLHVENSTPTFADSCAHIPPPPKRKRRRVIRSNSFIHRIVSSSSSSSSWWAAMGRSGIRLSCCRRSKAAAPIRLGSPQPKPKLKFVADRGASVAEAAGGDEAKKAVVTGRKIVVAVDSGPEAKAALQWALSHSLHGDDSLVLVSVVKPRRRRKLSSPWLRCFDRCLVHQFCLAHAADEHIILTGQSGAISGGRARARAGDRRGGQEAGSFAASSRAGEAIHSVACGQTVEWQQHEKRRIGGLLHPERLLHDSGREEEEQERRRWLFDHHQTPQQLLALSMSKSMRPMLYCTLPY